MKNSEFSWMIPFNKPLLQEGATKRRSILTNPNMKRLYEKKGHLIRRNPNLTDEQKQEIIELLGKHPSYDNKIDWNKNNSLTYEDFLKVLRPLYINDLDPRGLVEGEDYDILYESDDEVLYSVYTYNASRILASNNVKPEMWTKIPSWCGREEFTDEAHAFGYFDSEHEDMKPGAKWCISMQTSDRYWNDYSLNIHFLFWFRNNNRLKNNRKIAIGVFKRTWEVTSLYNGADNEIRTPLPSYIIEAIEKERENYKEKEINRIKSTFTFNPQTNRYDYDGDLDTDSLKNFVSEDKDGFIINFGKIIGRFNCSYLGLKSLKGAPTEVNGDFNCSGNKLTSLGGAPQKVGGRFWCIHNNLTSLEGAPQIVGEGFYCDNNQLTSLKGAPQKVGEDFYCYKNQLTSLKGAPKKVGGKFDCSYNLLTSLEGAPKKVKGSFICSNNQLTSLEGAPQEVGGSFNCYWNKLTSLKGAPQTVGEDFYCSGNKLNTLKGAPQIVNGCFDCSNNQLITLEGAPQIIGYWFDCYNNPNLHSLDGIGEVKGTIYKDFL